MGRTSGRAHEIELTPIGVKLSGLYDVRGGARARRCREHITTTTATAANAAADAAGEGIGALLLVVLVVKVILVVCLEAECAEVAEGIFNRQPRVLRSALPPTTKINQE